MNEGRLEGVSWGQAFLVGGIYMVPESVPLIDL